MRDASFDYAICIAVLHHLSTQERRVSALKEMQRILRPGGRALVTVWAKEQKYKDKQSFYINSKKGAAAKKQLDTPETGVQAATEPSAAAKEEGVHVFGKEFEKKDVFVAWHYKPKPAKKEKGAKVEAPKEDLSNKAVGKEGKVYLRFYHVFEKQELESLFQSVPGVRIVESFYEEGNWCVVFEKKTDLESHLLQFSE